MYLLYTTYKTYKVHLKQLKTPQIPHNPHAPFPLVDDKNSSDCPDKEFNLIGDLIPHSFKCKVLSGKSAADPTKLSPFISCAFVFDSSHIQLISFRVRKDLSTETVGSSKLKLFGNFSAVKIDFDENLLAVSGMFVAEPKDTKEDGLAGGILMYDIQQIAGRQGLFSGKLSAKELGFTPTSHNHHLQIVRSNQQTLVGVTDPQQVLKFYRVSEPALSFGDTGNADTSILKSVKLVVRGETGYRFVPLDSIFSVTAKTHPETSTTQQKPTQTDTDKKDSTKDKQDDHDDEDLDVSIPSAGEEQDSDSKKHRKHSSGGYSLLFYIFLLLLLAGGVRLYYWRQTKKLTSVRYHDPKVHPEQDTEVFDKTI